MDPIRLDARLALSAMDRGAPIVAAASPAGSAVRVVGVTPLLTNLTEPDKHLLNKSALLSSYQMLTNSLGQSVA